MYSFLKKALSVALSVAVCLSVMIVGAAATTAENATYQMADLEGYYKTQGRTALVDGAVMLDYSASGIEWTANCSGDVAVTVNATQMSSSYETAATGGLYFTVVVDGVVQSADLRIPEDTSDNWTTNSTGYPFHITALGESTFTIATGLSEGEHTFAIYNQTEANMGTFGVKSITLTGEFLEAPVANDLYVEFVGDSITAGHGNISTGSNNAPLYEDATRGWAYLTANALGADWSIIAQSGITAIDGIGWSGANSVSMQDVYPYQRYYSDTSTLYGFEREPDVIVLGLGTNDCWTWDTEGKGGPLTDEEKTAGLKAMLAQLRQYNPNAKIVWIYGMMSSGANSYILEAVSDMGGAGSGYYSLQLPTDTSGGHGHPGLAVQTTYAENVTEFISLITADSDQSSGWEIPTEKPAYVGSGTSSNDPYIITNGTQLYWAVSNENSGVYFKLANDIVLNEMTVDTANGTVSSEATLKEWYTGGTVYFKGTIDGDGHVIKGLYIDHEYTGSTSAWDMGYGLISHSNGAVVKNLGIENSFIKAVGGTASAFIGSIGNNVGNATIENCYIGSDVYLYGAQAGGFIGSGGAKKLTGGIKNCYSLATIKASTTYIGGIFGGVWSGSSCPVTNCYANMKMYGNNSAKFTNCFSTSAQATGVSALTTANMQGTAAQLNMNTLSEAFCITDSGYPTLRTFEGRTNGEWSGFRDDQLTGDGTEESPWLITTAEELAHVIYAGGKEDRYFKMEVDVNLNDIAKIDWTTGTVHSGYTPIGWYGSSFKGHFDGNGHVVHGLYVVETTNTAEWGGTGDALFPAFSSGSIKNVGVDNAFVQATNNAAAIVGYAGQTAERTIENCYAGADVTLKGYNAGGIYGSGDADLTITSCYSLASVSGSFKQAGISGGWWSYEYSGGKTSHNIYDCYTTNSKIQHSATKVENCIAGATAKGDAALNAYTVLSDAYVRIGANYPTLKVFTSVSENAPWNGLGDTSYIVEGMGDSAETPYIIENAGQLAHAIYNNGGGKYYKLANDIYFNDVSEGWLDREANLVWLQPTAEQRYGANNSAFEGYIEGDGYTVQGIYMPKDNPAVMAALIPAFSKGSIKNLGIRNSQIVGYNKTGGFVACVNGSAGGKVFDSLFVDDTVLVQFTGTESTVTGGAGGIVGYIYQGSSTNYTAISNCYSSATLVAGRQADQRQNGIVGIAWAAYYTVKNCYSLGYKPYHASNSNTTSKVTDAYANVYTDSTVSPSMGAYTNLTTDVIKSETALSSMTGLSDDVWYAVVGGGKAPMLRSYGITIGDVDENGEFELSGDGAALRQTLIGSASAKNADFDKNGSVNICDLVALHNK